MKDQANYHFWQRAAGLYDRFMQQDQNMYDRLCDCIRPELSWTQDVLELACGSGQLSFPLAREARQWEATDFSRRMIAQAKKKKQIRNLYFSVQDATKLPYVDGSFDVVIIANALHIMPDPEQALKESYRVLKEDGRLIAPTFLGTDQSSGGWKKRFLQFAGFKTYHQWNRREYLDFLSSHGFAPKEYSLIPGKSLTECYVLAEKKRKAGEKDA